MTFQIANQESAASDKVKGSQEPGHLLIGEMV